MDSKSPEHLWVSSVRDDNHFCESNCEVLHKAGEVMIDMKYGKLIRRQYCLFRIVICVASSTEQLLVEVTEEILRNKSDPDPRCILSDDYWFSLNSLPDLLYLSYFFEKLTYKSNDVDMTPDTRQNLKSIIDYVSAKLASLQK